MKVYRKITFSPRARGKSRVQIDGVPIPGKEGLLSKGQVLALGLRFLEAGKSFTIGPSIDQARGSSQKTPKRRGRKGGR